MFQNAFRNVTCERPPLLLQGGESARIVQSVRIPLLVRGGCGITKKSRSHRSAADGVVAHTHMFQNAFRSVTCERPPRPRLFGTGPFLDAPLNLFTVSMTAATKVADCL